MEENIKNLLSEEIVAEIQALSELSSGGKEKSTAIEDMPYLFVKSSAALNFT